jgi:nickel-dependent lactate racemase
MKGAAPLDDEGIRQALLKPIGTPRLRDLARGKTKVCIAVDDLTRSTEAWRIVPYLLEELYEAGIRDRQIYFVVSLGTHRPFTYEDAVKKLGRAIYENHAVYSHNAYQNLVRLGETSGGTPITINRYFYEADLRIMVGTLTPHPYAGFSGGAKGLMPGLAGFESIDVNHKPINTAMQGHIGQTHGNTRRADMTEAARAIGLDFLVNTVVNQDARTAGVFAGDLEEAFEAAAEMARVVNATDAPYEADIGIFNTYPRDNFFLMSLNALNVWSIRDGKHELVRKGGVVLIVNNCSEGLGTHGLYELHYPHHVRRDASGTFGSMIRDRHLVFYSPRLSEAMIRDHYSEEVIGFRDWDACVEHVQQVMPAPQSISVFPNGSIQFDRRALE